MIVPCCPSRSCAPFSHMPASVWQEHALSCGAPLKRVYGRGGPYYSSHSMGMVNVFRLVCDEISRLVT